MSVVPLEDKTCKLNLSIKKDNIRKKNQKDRTEENNNCI